jgi:hypothetical protein
MQILVSKKGTQMTDPRGVDESVSANPSTQQQKPSAGFSTAELRPYPPHNIDLDKKTDLSDLDALNPSSLSTREVVTQPSPPIWTSERSQRQGFWRPSPWGIAISLLLLCGGLDIALSGPFFSAGAFLIEVGLAFWLVIILRQGLDQPYSSLLLPFGLVFFLLGLEVLVDIPLIGSLVVMLGLWVLWGQIRRRH